MKTRAPDVNSKKWPLAVDSTCFRCDGSMDDFRDNSVSDRAIQEWWSVGKFLSFTTAQERVPVPYKRCQDFVTVDTDVIAA
jgi:hypothetical protein